MSIETPLKSEIIQLPKIEDHSDCGIPYIEPSPELAAKFLGANDKDVVFALLKLSTDEILHLPESWTEMDPESQIKLIEIKTAEHRGMLS